MMPLIVAPATQPITPFSKVSFTDLHLAVDQLWTLHDIKRSKCVKAEEVTDNHLVPVGRTGGDNWWWMCVHAHTSVSA